jgi:hypothetical protein
MHVSSTLLAPSQGSELQLKMQITKSIEEELSRPDVQGGEIAREKVIRQDYRTGSLRQQGPNESPSNDHTLLDLGT